MAHKLNLLPTDIAEREEWRRSLLRWGRTMLLGMAVIAVTYGASRLWFASLKQDVVRLHKAEASSQAANEKIGHLQAERDRLAKIEQVYQDLGEKGTTGLILNELGQAMPPRVWLTRLEMNAPEMVALQGETVSNTDLADFLARLNRSAQFPNAVLKFSRAQSGEQGKFLTFEVRQDARNPDTK